MFESSRIETNVRMKAFGWRWRGIGMSDVDLEAKQGREELEAESLCWIQDVQWWRSSLAYGLGKVH